MAWWAWLAVAAVLVVVVLTRRWNPISRASAASELGRRYPVLIHFWRVWTVLAAAGIAGVAILLAIHPGTHVATAPAKVAKPSPAVSPRAPAASPTPVATPTPVAVSPSQGHIPGPVFIAVLIGLGMAAALTVWLARRHREEPDYWLDDYSDVNGDEYDADGWPTGSDPDPSDDDTEDEDHEADQDVDQVDQGVDEYDAYGDPDPGGVVGACPVRGVPHRGRWLPRRR